MMNSGLKKLQKSLEKLSSTTTVPLTEMMPPSFVAACSKFSNLQELFDNSGFKMDTAEDFAAIPDAEWDAFIARSTSYASWEAMQKAAHGAWLKKQFK